MPRVSDLDEFLHADSVQDGEVVTIIAKPTLISEEESVFGKAYFEIPITTANGEAKTWTPNKTTLKKLSAKFGDETDAWIGKKVKISKAKMNVRGEMKQVIFGEPSE